MEFEHASRSRQELSNGYLIEKIGVDTAENESPNISRNAGMRTRRTWPAQALLTTARGPLFADGALVVDFLSEAAGDGGQSATLRFADGRANFGLAAYTWRGR